MKIFIVLFVLFWSSQLHYAGNYLDLNGVIVCATLNNVTRTFSNIWEIFSEFKRTGQLWVPVAINACPVTHVDCSSFSPVCAVSSNNLYRTFPNECGLHAERKATGIAWKIVFNGICSTNLNIHFVNVNIATPLSQEHLHNENNQYGDSSQSQPSDQSLDQNIAINYNPESSTSIYNAPSSSLSSHDAHKYGAAQQAQTLKHYPETLQPFSNGDFSQNSAQSAPSFHKIGTQAANNRPSLASHFLPTCTSCSSPAQEPYKPIQEQKPVKVPVDESSSTSDSFSLSADGEYNSVQRPESLRKYPDQIQPFGNGQMNQNSAHISGNSVYPPACVSSNPNEDEGRSLGSAGNCKLQQPPNYTDAIQLFDNGQINQNSAELSTSSPNFPLSSNLNQIAVQSQVDQGSSLTVKEGHNSIKEHQPELMQQFDTKQKNQNSEQFPASSVNLPGKTSQTAVKFQRGQVSLPSSSSSSYDRSSPSPGRLYILFQLPQLLPNNPELIQPFDSEQINQNTAQLPSSSDHLPPSGKWTEIDVQFQEETASIPSNSLPTNDGSTPSTAEQYNTNQHPQSMPNSPESLQPFGNGQLNQKAVQMTGGSGSLPPPSNSHHIVIQGQTEKGFSLSEKDDYSSIQQSQPAQKHPEPVQSFDSEQINQNSEQFPASSANLPGKTNQNAVKLQRLKVSLPSSSTPYYDSSPPSAAGLYISFQLPQLLPNNPEQRQPFKSGQIKQNTAQMPSSSDNLPPSGKWTQIELQFQKEPAFLPSNYLPTNDGSTPSVAKQYNTTQLPQPMPNFTESVKPFVNGQINKNIVQMPAGSGNLPLPSISHEIAIKAETEQGLSIQQPQFFGSGQIYQNSAQIPESLVNLPENSNQTVAQFQREQASLPSCSSSFYNTSSPSAVGQHNSIQQPQLLPNYPELMQPSDNLPFSGRWTQVPEEPDSLPSQSLPTNDGSAPSTAEQYNTIQHPQPMANSPESRQLFSNGQVSQNAADLSNLPLPSISHQIGIQVQAEQGFSLTKKEANNSIQQPQPTSIQKPWLLQNYSELMQTFDNEQMNRNTLKLPSTLDSLPPSGRWTQKAVNFPEEPASLPSHSSPTNDGSTPSTAEQYNTIQHPQTMPNSPESVQPFDNGLNQNTPQLSENSVNSSHSGYLNQFTVPHEAEQGSLVTGAVNNNLIHKPQSVPKCRKPKQPAGSEQNYVEFPASLDNLPLSGKSNQGAVQFQTAEGSLPSYSSPSHDGSAPYTGEQYNSLQHSQPMPNSPESIQEFNDEQIKLNSVQLPETSVNLPLSSNSSQITIQLDISGKSNSTGMQFLVEQTSLPSYSLLSYDSSTSSATVQYYSTERPQTLPNYSEQIQPFANEQINKTIAQLQSSSENLPLTDNSNQFFVQSDEKDFLSSFNSSSSVPVTEQFNDFEHTQTNSPEAVQQFGNGQVYRITTHYNLSVVLILPTLANAEGNSNSQLNLNSCGQTSRVAIDSTQSDESYSPSIDECSCSNSQTDTSSVLNSQNLPSKSLISDVISSTNDDSQHYSHETIQNDNDNIDESKIYNNDYENSKQYPERCCLPDTILIRAEIEIH